MFGYKHRQPILIGEFENIIDNIAVRYSVKRSYRAKYVRIEIRRQTGLTIFIPRFYKVSELSDLLQNKKSWILNKLAEVKKLSEINLEKQKQGTIPYLGKYITCKKRDKPEEVGGVRLEGNTLLINDDKYLKLDIESWYRKQAESIIKEKAAELCKIMEVNYNRLTIRGARTRWGSCSQKGNLNFNWKLVMAPEPIIDYVIVHELAHLKEMNHSQRFWNMVTRYCPQWQQHKKWLEENEAELTISNL